MSTLDILKKLVKYIENNILDVDININNDNNESILEDDPKQYTCMHIIKKGSRKGQVCCKPVRIGYGNEDRCGLHSDTMRAYWKDHYQRNKASKTNVHVLLK